MSATHWFVRDDGNGVVRSDGPGKTFVLGKSGDWVRQPLFDRFVFNGPDMDWDEVDPATGQQVAAQFVPTTAASPHA